ncbi:phosphotransferase family protein [Planobispora rosea]|uniref:Aminoglycoside phosphotransferase domain-containing protein n=1 Tax=Planobispora rosea TaxID=35762 RepID=A0A8J3WEN7_PLARO|nr:phosphotransferase [Planobispora rosea]GIH86433.1 hypothetical protein Pro02_48410 [Planobispora rosea]
MQWSDLPTTVNARIAADFGAHIQHIHTPPGGFGHQLAAALTLHDGQRLFVKAAPRDDRLTRDNLREAAILASLPAEAPAADLLGILHIEDWTLIIISHLSGTHPAFHPGSPAVDEVLERLSRLTATTAPQRYRQAIATPTATTALHLHGWASLNTQRPDDLDTWAADHLAHLVALESAWLAQAHGDYIVHADLRADNMIDDPQQGIVFVDWTHASLGPAFADAASLAPQWVMAGHCPQAVADLLARHPLTCHDRQGVDSFLAALTGHWERNSRYPSPPRAPGLRTYQRRAAAAGRALLAARLS